MEGPAFEGLLTLSGRRSRRSYGILLAWFLAIHAAVLYVAVVKDDAWAWELEIAVLVILGGLHVNALAQRLRDTGRSGKFAFILVMAFQRGQIGTNQYGIDPLYDPLKGADRR